jgi:hypothetical protein
MNPLDLSKFTKYGQGKNYYKITVQDNGIGFDDKYAEDIFRVFKRLIATRNSKARVLACQFVRRSLKNIMDLSKPKAKLMMVPLSSLVCPKCKWQIERTLQINN